MVPSISPYITASGKLMANEGRRGTHLVLARSPDLARVLTIRSPSVQSVVLAVVLLDLASTGIS